MFSVINEIPSVPTFLDDLDLGPREEKDSLGGVAFNRMVLTV